MDEFLSELLKAQPDTLLVIGGVALLMIAAVGNISGKIQPGKEGRIACGPLAYLTQRSRPKAAGPRPLWS